MNRFSVPTLKDGFLALPRTISPGWKVLPGTNTLAYYEYSNIGPGNKHSSNLANLASSLLTTKNRFKLLTSGLATATSPFWRRRRYTVASPFKTTPS